MAHRIKIRYPSELTALHSWRVTPSRTRAQLHLDIKGVSRERIKLWERELMRHQNPCGCEQGAGGLLVGIISYLLYLLLRPGGWGHPGWFEVCIGCGVILVTTSVGKGLGILLSRRRIRQIVREMQTEWRPQRSQERDYGVVSAVNVNRTRRCCSG
jgi:hypothetical protein